jgi:uncharacterized membrane protein
VFVQSQGQAEIQHRIIFFTVQSNEYNFLLNIQHITYTEFPYNLHNGQAEVMVLVETAGLFLTFIFSCNTNFVIRLSCQYEVISTFV